MELNNIKWVKAASVDAFPEEGGACVLVEGEQIAVYNFTSKGEWFATQNLCPHKQEMILSRGMIGDLKGEPKVACPLHKKQFSLNSGACLTGEDYSIKTYPVKEEEGVIFIGISQEN